MPAIRDRNEVLMYLADGFVLEGNELVKRIGAVPQPLVDELLATGITRRCNGFTSFLSDEGKKAYLRSTDEMRPTEANWGTPEAAAILAGVQAGTVKFPGR